MNRCSIPLIAVGVLAGCATAPQPPLGADNPASPSAPEAIEHLLRNSLAADDVTKKTLPALCSGRQPTRADCDAATAADGSNAWNEDALARQHSHAITAQTTNIITTITFVALSSILALTWPADVAR